MAPVPKNDCPENYIGDTAWRILERVKYHAGKDVYSYLCRHAIESKYEVLDVTNYIIIGKGSRNNTRKHKTTEALLILKSQ